MRVDFLTLSVIMQAAGSAVTGCACFLLFLPSEQKGDVQNNTTLIYMASTVVDVYGEKNRFIFTLYNNRYL